MIALDDVERAAPDLAPRRIQADRGACRYDLGDRRSLEVDVFPAQSEASLSARSAGTIEGVGRTRTLRLDTPGVGAYVAKDGALVLLAVRTTDASTAGASRAMVDALAPVVAKRLPAGVAPTRRLADRDPCDVVPPAKLVPDLEGGDPRSPQVCAYRDLEGTLIAIDLGPTDEIDTSRTEGGEAWPEAGRGSRWSGRANPEGRGGAAVGSAIVGDATVVVTVSSPLRPLAELKQIGERIVELVRAAA